MMTAKHFNKKIIKIDDNRLLWLEFYKNLSIEISKRSSVERMKVGAVIFDNQTKNIISLGYNGPPAGFTKAFEEDYAYHVHAEVNALNRTQICNNNCSMIVTHQPCMRCAQNIIASKPRINIKNLYFINEFKNTEDKYAHLSSIDFMKEAGIFVGQI